MSINAIPSNAYWLASQPRNAEKQAVSTETAAMQDTAKSASSSVTVLSARNNTAGQNIPTYTSAATNAALLATQEVETAPATTNTDPTPWEAAGYTSRREWLLSGEYVPEGMEGRDNYVVFVALDEVPEEIRLIQEKKMQEEFDNPFASYEEQIASAESNVEVRQQSLALAKAELDKYQSEESKYPDFIKDIHGRISNAEAGLKEAQEHLERAKTRYAEAEERIAAREPGPVFNISYKLTDMATPIDHTQMVLHPDLAFSATSVTELVSDFQTHAKELERSHMLLAARQGMEVSQQHLEIMQSLTR